MSRTESEACLGFQLCVDDIERSVQVLADPESPEASRPPLIFVDDKVSRDSTEEVTNLIRSVSIAVFLRLRLELLGLQGVEYGDPKTIQRVFGKSREEIEPQHQLIKLLSGIILPQLPALELPTLDTEIKATPQKV